MKERMKYVKNNDQMLVKFQQKEEKQKWWRQQKIKDKHNLAEITLILFIILNE
jgi:hypothetical protein